MGSIFWDNQFSDETNAMLASSDAAESRMESERQADEIDRLTAELTEARRLLDMATAFDAGRLIEDLGHDWEHGDIVQDYAEETVTVRKSWDDPSDLAWEVTLDGLDCWLWTDGAWRYSQPDDEAVSRWFPTPAAALAALDAWRAARRAEIADAANAAMDEMVRINQETGQYDDLRPNPLVRSGGSVTQQGVETPR